MNHKQGDKVLINDGLLKGKIAVITQVIPTGYRIDLDGGKYVWGDHMFYEPTTEVKAKTMIDNSKEYILCAAILRKIPKDVKVYYHNDIGKIEIGYRHCDIFPRFPGELQTGPDAQGFYTSKGRFVSREEGMKIARECGQFSSDRDDLFSEDLY